MTASKNYIFLGTLYPKKSKRIDSGKPLKRISQGQGKIVSNWRPKRKRKPWKVSSTSSARYWKRAFSMSGRNKGSVRLLFQALGVKYHDNKLSFTNSNKHTVPVRLGNLPFPKNMEKYVSTGFVRQNHLVLEILAEQNSENSPKLTASAIFLPMIFPKLYEKMNPVYKKQYESVALGSYVKNAERMHAPFEKSPKDYIALFNAKGFYFTRREKGFEVKSIYTDNRNKLHAL